MVRTLILYESRYGFTEKLAKDLSLILGPAKCSRASEYTGGTEYDVIVLCAPVYSETIDRNMLTFSSQNSDWIANKKVILLCTCLGVNAADYYLEPFNELFGPSIIFKASVPGELILDRLSSSDYDLMEKFSRAAGMELKSYKSFHQDSFAELALKIKQIKDSCSNSMKKETLEPYMEDFIQNHNICVLATGYGNRVRATPIEYIYWNGNLYILSEGGEKFANILLNQEVSLSINDEYKGMNKLGGMQFMGSAEIVSIGSDEYILVLAEKNLKFDKISALPVALNMVRIKISRIEFLWSKFRELGYDAKQILYKD